MTVSSRYKQATLLLLSPTDVYTVSERLQRPSLESTRRISFIALPVPEDAPAVRSRSPHLAGASRERAYHRGTATRYATLARLDSKLLSLTPPIRTRSDAFPLTSPPFPADRIVLGTEKGSLLVFDLSSASTSSGTFAQASTVLTRLTDPFLFIEFDSSSLCNASGAS
jgi:hypothetical protein